MAPDQALAAASNAVATLSGHALHREFDRLSNLILRNAGYAEFVDMFERAIADGHADGQPYPLGAAA